MDLMTSPTLRRKVWINFRALIFAATLGAFVFAAVSLKKEKRFIGYGLDRLRKGFQKQLPKIPVTSDDTSIIDRVANPNNAIDSVSGQENDEQLNHEHVLNYSAIWMDKDEANIILEQMKRNVRFYLEWGSGGSTVNFAPLTQIKAYSIEHDKDWCSDMKTQISTQNLTKKIEYHCVPVKRGYLGWGNGSPFEEGNYSQFKEYIDRIDVLGVPVFDLVLIDGRARVFAAIKALAYISDRSRVILHDAKRMTQPVKPTRNYSTIGDYYDLEVLLAKPSATGIAVLKRKQKWNWLQGNVTEVDKLLIQLD